MKSITKLKDQARQFEQKEDWDRAIQAYLEVLEAGERKEGEVELPVLNRVGDLYLRMGRSDDAFEFYSRAVDRYAEVGLYNNAIALCSKALRYLPNRIIIYRRLGQLSAAQGFLPDARRWFLEFAERAFATKRLDEAFEALEEFAGLSDDPEIREMLGRQLHEHGRDADAVAQLLQAHALRLAAGQKEEAAALEAEIRALDPEAVIAAAPEGGDAAPATAPPGARAAEPDSVEAEQTGEEEESDGEHLEFEQFGPGDDAAVEPLETLPIESSAIPSEAEDEAASPAIGGIEIESMLEAAGLGDEAPEAEIEVERLVEDEPAASLDEDEPAEPLPILEGTEPDDDEPADASSVLDDSEFDDGGDAFDEDEEPLEPLPILEGTEVDAFEDEPALEPLSVPDDEEPEPDGSESLVLTGLDADGTDDEEPDAGEGELDDLSFLSGIDFGKVSDADEDEPGSSAESLSTLSESLSGGGEGRRETGSAAKLAELPDAGAEIARIREIAASGDPGAAANAFVVVHDELAAAGALEEAGRVIDAWVEIAPDDVRAYQCRVEDAARTADPALLVNAYLALAECLRRTGSEVKAVAVFQQVLDLDPTNESAAAALAGAPEAAGGGADYIDLQSLVGDGVTNGEEEPAASSLNGMLSQFKAKTGAEAARDDSENHYDLGLAFKEMGLVDEAIGEFQTALRGGEERLKVYEELGQCYMLKEQYNVALKVLARALQLPRESDEELVGVYYHLGRCHEELGERSEARTAYEKIEGVDGEFRDVSQRLSRL